LLLLTSVVEDAWYMEDASGAISLLLSLALLQEGRLVLALALGASYT